MSKEKILTKLATPSDLREKGRQEIATAINPLVADAFALYVKTKNFHWHISGSHFRDYHLLLDEQADQILEMIDVLAERLRKIGEVTIRSIGQINQLKNVKDDEGPFLDAQKMLKRLMQDNRDFVVRMRAAHEVCSKNDDFATTSILEILIDEAERRIWFLFESTAK